MPFYYLKFEGGKIDIKGVGDGAHAEEVVVRGFAFAEVQEAKDGAMQKNVVMRDLIIRLAASKATPLLYAACASATTFTKVTLTFVKTVNNQSEDIMKWILEGNVLISQYRQVGSEDEVEAMQPAAYTDVKGLTAQQAVGPISLNAPEPFEEIHLSYKKLGCWYRQEKDGNIDPAIAKGWDKTKNEPYEVS